jgi:transposase
MDEKGRLGSPQRVPHNKGLFRGFLESLPKESPIAIESIGSWYWIVDEMEKAGHRPVLCNPGKAKLLMGQPNKTDKLDAGGLATLLRNGTLPSVWTPPSEIRDQRELPRMRMSLVRMRTAVKNRIHASFAKYAITFEETSDLFNRKGMVLIQQALTKLPPETRRAVESELRVLERLEEEIQKAQARMKEAIRETPEMQLLMTLPGVGSILASTIACEIGRVDRFPRPESLASYSGLVPRVHASGGRSFLGRARSDINHYLKWAFIEAANVIAINRKSWVNRHVVKLYERIKDRKGHQKAVGAVARHLSEAAYWVLTKNEPYREPILKQSCFTDLGVNAVLA